MGLRSQPPLVLVLEGYAYVGLASGLERDEDERSQFDDEGERLDLLDERLLQPVGEIFDAASRDGFRKAHGRGTEIVAGRSELAERGSR
jgi:hypothetical protein